MLFVMDPEALQYIFLKQQDVFEEEDSLIQLSVTMAPALFEECSIDHVVSMLVLASSSLVLAFWGCWVHVSHLYHLSW